MKLEQACKQYLDRVYRYLLVRVNNKELAQDLTSTTFDKVIRKYGTFNPKKASISTWIFTIANNTLVDHFRKHKDDKSVDLEEGIIGNEKVQIEAMKFLVLKELDSLNDEQKLMLHLHFTEGYKYGEIAKEIGKKEGAVKTQMYRIFKKLEKNKKLEGIIFN